MTTAADRPEGREEAEALAWEGNRLFQKGDFAAAMRAYERALSIEPSQPSVEYHLGLMWLKQGADEQAMAHFRAAVALDRTYYKAHVALAEVELRKGLLGLARQHFETAAALQPESAGVWSRLGKLEFLRGNAKGAADCYERAWRADGKAHAAASNYLYCSAFRNDVSPNELAEACVQWGRQFDRPDGAVGRSEVLDRDADPQRKLRIGYLSPDFREHSLRFFFEAIAKHHDRRRFALYGYCDTKKSDGINAGFREHADAWRDTAGMADSEVAAIIRQDRLDILVELAGHTRNNRLPMLAERLAPIQITGLGYPCTTGLGSIDYKLSDAVADPPGAEAFYSESLLRLPECFWCFTPPAGSPGVAPSPCLANRRVTFGCFGEPCKISDVVLRNWRLILHQLPEARLLVKLPRWGHADNVAYLSDRLAEFGLHVERVQLQGPSVPIDAFLQSYGQVDVILDTFPFNGGTTTCMALWMGVPVVTLAGNHLASRMGATILTHCGLHELIAETSAEYIAKAVALGSVPVRLSALRATIRDKMLEAPLTDGRRYVSHLESAYRTIWADWCRKLH